MDEDYRLRGGLMRDRERVQPERERGRQSRNGRRPERRDRPRQPRSRVSLVEFTDCVGVHHTNMWYCLLSHSSCSLLLLLCMYTEWLREQWIPASNETTKAQWSSEPMCLPNTPTSSKTNFLFLSPATSYAWISIHNAAVSSQASPSSFIYSFPVTLVHLAVKTLSKALKWSQSLITTIFLTLLL